MEPHICEVSINGSSRFISLLAKSIPIEACHLALV